MPSLPQPLLQIIYASIGVSAVTTTFALIGLALGASPLVWIIPAAFCATLPYHIVILFLARVELPSSPRLFSRLNINWGWITALLWTAATIVSVVATVLQAQGSLPHRDMRIGIWILVVSAVLSLVEGSLVWVMAVLNRKERRRITYSAKWRFNPTSSSLSSQSWRA